MIPKAAPAGVLALLAAGAGPAFAQSTGDEPAGGAAATEAIGATLGAVAATALVALLIAGHRSGRIGLLDRLARVAERRTGLPAWAALPSALLSVSLLGAVLGMYWDISLHIDNGRDDGPLANPAHYLILLGLYGSLVAGALAIALPRGRPSGAAVHLGAGYWAPVGGLMVAASGAFALAGFPLDDLWHRLFGQDVTLWGPTHLMLIGGGSLAVLSGMVLLSEAVAALGYNPERTDSPRLFRVRRGLLVGGLLVALSTFQGEFDFGVPQFRQVLHPVLIMLAAAVGLVAARIYLGRGGAILAVLGFLAIRGFIAVMVGGVWGQTTPHFPLYIVEALLAEAVFARSARRSPVAAGAVAGAVIGTIGLATEWGWMHLWMPIPWTSALLPEAVVAGLLAAVAGGAVGGFVGGALTGRTRAIAQPTATRPLERADRLGALASALALVAVIGWGLPLSAEGPAAATLALHDVRPVPERAVEASIRIRPADAADGAEFFNVTAWQGGASVVDPLEKVAEGVYRTSEAIPVHDGWKALVRLQRGDALVALPLYLPRDSAIPAGAVPARRTSTREFQPDAQLLQRERKEGVSALLTAGAYLTVLAFAVSLIALLAWSLLRVAGGPRRDGRAETSPRAHAGVV